MKNNNRMIRINDEIQKELADIFRVELKDPRISAMTSVLRVDTTNDLKQSKIYVSVLADDSEKKEVMKGIESANGFIRKLLASRLNLRNTPELIFKLDDSVEYAIRMASLIDEVNRPQEASSN